MNHNLKSGGAFVGNAILFFRGLLLSGWISLGFLTTATAQTYTPPANNRVDINSGFRLAIHPAGCLGRASDQFR